MVSTDEKEIYQSHLLPLPAEFPILLEQLNKPQHNYITNIVFSKNSENDLVTS